MVATVVLAPPFFLRTTFFSFWLDPASSRRVSPSSGFVYSPRSALCNKLRRSCRECNGNFSPAIAFVKELDQTCDVQSFVGALPQPEIIDAVIEAEVVLGSLDGCELCNARAGRWSASVSSNLADTLIFLAGSLARKS